MKRISMAAGLFSLLCGVSTVLAQNPPSQATALKQAYNEAKEDILQAAGKMGAPDYNFQPTSAERTFGGWVAHVADAQMNACSRINGAPQRINAGAKTSKADLVAALRESFAACDQAYGATTDENANAPAQSYRGQTTRLAALWGNVAHDNECYGSMAVYLRLKGIVPPSTENMGRGRGGKKE